MWELLVWAYQREMVRFAGAAAAGYSLDWRDVSATGSVQAALEMGIAGRGGDGWASGGRPSAHADADTVHHHVSRLDTAEQWSLIRAAEAGQAPDWAPDAPPLRVKPVLTARGKPKTILCPVARVPVACLIRLEGVSAEERESYRAKARLAYLDWWLRLRWLRDALVADDVLRRWQITGIGVEMEPWAANLPHSVAAGS
jgi:hypothetical protein